MMRQIACVLLMVAATLTLGHSAAATLPAQAGEVRAWPTPRDGYQTYFSSIVPISTQSHETAALLLHEHTTLHACILPSADLPLFSVQMCFQPTLRTGDTCCIPVR